MKRRRHEVVRVAPSQIDAAVDRVAQRTDQAGPALKTVQLITFPGAVGLQAGQQLEILAPEVEGAAVVLVQQAGQPWRAITLPPGSTWILTEKLPDLWLPAGAARKSQ